MITISDAIEAALDGDAVLITGSGASLGATNKLGKEIPTASGLKDLLLAKCEMTDPKSEATLQYAAQKYRRYAALKYKDTRDEHFRPFAVWCGWVCQVVTVLRSSLPQVR